jgi:hypothetical protein
LHSDFIRSQAATHINSIPRATLSDVYLIFARCLFDCCAAPCELLVLTIGAGGAPKIHCLLAADGCEQICYEIPAGQNLKASQIFV